jgi:membrane-associated phospholipid phosphatase
VALLTERMTLRRALIVVAATVIGVFGLLPFDGLVLRLTTRFQPGHNLQLGGDLKREVEFVQQWGDVVCVLLVGAAVLLLDPRVRRRLWDGVAALAATAIVYEVLKIGIGRPRPKFNDPWHFCGPFTTYPLVRGGVTVMRHSWELWAGISSDLWSMPSSHTAAATALSVVLARLYPRLAPLLVVMAVLVGVCRVVLAAHYPSDVLVGWGLGVVMAGVAMDREWGQRIVAKVRGSAGGVEGR